MKFEFLVEQYMWKIDLQGFDMEKAQQKQQHEIEIKIKFESRILERK